MSNIMQKPQTAIGTVGLEPPPFKKSLNRGQRKKELIRITMENQSLLKRLQDKQPVQNHVKWENDFQQAENYKAVCSNSIMESHRDKYLAKSARGMMRGDESYRAQTADGQRKMTPKPKAMTPSDPKKVKTASAGKRPMSESRKEEKTLLFKKGKVFNDKFYIVEINLIEGNMVTVVAQDVESPETIANRFSDEEFMQYFEACEKDYDKLLSLLDIQNDLIVINPPNNNE